MRSATMNRINRIRVHMKRHHILLLLITTFWLNLPAQQLPKSQNTTSPKGGDDLTIPICTAKSIITRHTGYTVSYNPTYHDANWVSYLLTRQKAAKGQEARTNKFKPDPTISSGTATNADYARSGFDKGHLAPAADMSWSKQAMDKSFYFSNMTPQRPSFNRGIWKKLEEQIRSWAEEYDSLYIVTGPLLTPNLPAIGRNKVAIPQTFYKVILRYSKKDASGIGFLFENRESKASLSDCATSIDNVEKATGIDFFPALNDIEEQKIESKVNITKWIWKQNGK